MPWWEESLGFLHSGDCAEFFLALFSLKWDFQWEGNIWPYIKSQNFVKFVLRPNILDKGKENWQEKKRMYTAMVPSCWASRKSAEYSQLPLKSMGIVSAQHLFGDTDHPIGSGPIINNLGKEIKNRWRTGDKIAHQSLFFFHLLASSWILQSALWPQHIHDILMYRPLTLMERRNWHTGSDW